MGISFSRAASSGGIVVKRCSDCVHASSYHLHEELAIARIERGQTRLSDRGRARLARKGDIVLIPPFEPHRCVPADARDWGFAMVFIRDPALRGLGGGRLAIKAGGRLSELFNGVLAAATGPGTGEGERLCRTVRALLAEMSPDYRIPGRAPGDGSRDGVASARDTLAREFRKPPRLEELAASFGYDAFRLIREFRGRYGITPMAYAAQLRVAYAKRLVTGGLPAAEAAYEAGYYDQAHMTRSFKANYGVGPARYARWMASSIPYKNGGEAAR